MSNEVRRVRRRKRVQSVYGRRRISPARVALYVASLAAGFLLAYLVLTYAPRAYSTWRESRLMKQAHESMEKGDLEAASQRAHEILQVRPNSVAAFHILADTTEKQHKPETVAWRAQIARVLPQNLDAHLNLASAALRFGQLDTARRALDGVAEADRDKPAYHVVAGWLAKAQGNEQAVEDHFAAAVAKEPDNDLYQFNLAVLRIRSPEPQKYEEALNVLERLRKVTGFRAGSLRALLTDAVQRDELERADILAQELQMHPQVTFADYLLSLDFYRKLDEKKFGAVLEKVKPVAARDAGDLARLMDWMNKNGMAAEVLKWSDKLPSETTSTPPPAIAIAEALAEVKNWSRLKRWTRTSGWGDSEYLRNAFQAYSSRQLKQAGTETEFDALWRAAERAAAESPDRELNLARLATKWELTAEAEQLWLRVAKHTPLRREALDALYRIYRASNSMKQLLNVARQLHESSPREVSLTTNYARLALLLASTTDDAQRKAKEAHEAAPKDVRAAVTYAFGLYMLGRTPQGIEVLNKIPRGELEDPHEAVYAAVLFADDNQIDLAKEFSAAARTGPLFPEEKKLLDEVIAKVAGASAPSPPPSEPAQTPAAPPAAPAEMTPAAATPAPSP
jgi:lipopolysaccharide biosynthesis regulator YciM